MNKFKIALVIFISVFAAYFYLYYHYMSPLRYSTGFIVHRSAIYFPPDRTHKWPENFFEPAHMIDILLRPSYWRYETKSSYVP